MILSNQLTSTFFYLPFDTLLIRYGVIILFSFSGLIINYGDNLVVAQTEVLDSLSIPDSDPLLPPHNVNRELSPLEKKRIYTEIETLETAAQNKLNQGETSAAFELWFRQLRLYRAISLAEEITALGRIGAIAWQNNQKQQLKVINQRLTNIYQTQQTANNLTSNLLTKLGTSFQQIRDLNQAIAMYQALLKNSRRQDKITQEKQYLEILGELYLDKFDYHQAKVIYQELMTLVTEKIIDNSEFISYTTQLIKIHNYLQETRESIIVKQQLIDYYLEVGNTEPIASLKIALADDYQLIEKTESAIKYYQEAINLSSSLQQIALSTQALNKLGTLYQKQKQYTLAIQTYQQLLKVEQQAFNSYGVMNSYENLGKIYLILEDYQQALTAFTQGLDIAKSLNYQVRHFNDLIQQAKAKIE